ncbi:MAG TPA: BamA/TamA family outer membrane protein, partial [Longimicrobiales bacterium]|nr:BamA/TamA family outer membrane protein [Longimicrobiales bacterium]
VGSFFGEELRYPFVGEVGRAAGRQLYQRRRDRFAYWAGQGRDFTHVLLPLDEESVELTLAGRIGEPGNLTVFGVGFANHTLHFPGYPGDVEVAHGGNFDRTEPADSGIAGALAAQTRFSSGTRVNLLFGQRNIHFVRRQGLDALTGVQDVPVGFELALTLGRSIGSFSFDDDEPDDLYTRIRLFQGVGTGPLLLNLSAGWEAREVFSGGRAGRGWKDIIGELDGILYWQPEALTAHTLFARLAASGGWKMTLPFQLSLGGSTGVRGYPEETWPGARRVVLTAEDRLYVPWPAPRLFDFGFTFFGDAGRMWPGDVPFGTASGWRGAVGAGLRFGFPAGSRGVVRLDLAFPVDRARAGDPILRLALVDVVG